MSTFSEINDMSESQKRRSSQQAHVAIYTQSVALVVFTKNLQRHVECPPTNAPGNTVREVLDAVFQDIPLLRGYIVNERGSLRKHMTIFVDGELITDRKTLSDSVTSDSEIYVMQALSGG